jgi:hypothetical protein
MRLIYSVVTEQPKEGGLFSVLFYYYGDYGHFDVFLLNHSRIK